jgi:hypothetical protein
MKVLTFIATVITCAVTSLAAEVHIGDKPQLKMMAIDGTAVDLAALKGKIIVVDFWTSRSDLGKNYERHLIDVYRKYHDQGVEFVGICCDTRAGEAEKAVHDLGISWPVCNELLGWRDGIAKEWGVPRLNWDYLIAPDGAVLWIGVPARIEDQIELALAQHPPVLVDPDVLKKATTDLDEAEQALNDHDRAKAIQRFMHPAPEVKKDRTFAKRYASLQPKIEQTAQELIAEAEPLISTKQFSKAAGFLHDVAELTKGLPEEATARQKLAELLANPEAKQALDADRRNSEAAAALAMARTIRDRADAIQAYKKFKAITQDYSDTPAAKDAASVVANYESDQQFMQQVKDEAVAAKATPMLALCDSYRNAGKLDQAREKYQQVVQQFTGTRFAEIAKQRLAEMK